MYSGFWNHFRAISYLFGYGKIGCFFQMIRRQSSRPGAQFQPHNTVHTVPVDLVRVTTRTMVGKYIHGPDAIAAFNCFLARRDLLQPARTDSHDYPYWVDTIYWQTCVDFLRDQHSCNMGIRQWTGPQWGDPPPTQFFYAKPSLIWILQPSSFGHYWGDLDVCGHEGDICQSHSVLCHPAV